MYLTRAFILLCFVTALASCHDAPIVYPQGGYNYPKTVEDSNDYTYPIKDSFPPRKHPIDPYKFLMPFFDEPNISLAPKPNPVFRLFLFGSHSPAVITLIKDSIIIKKSHDEFWLRDTSILTPDEKIQLRLLSRKSSYRYITERAAKSTKFKDSLLKLYPRLFDEGYRDTLYKKDRDNPIRNMSFHYTVTRKQITHIEYYELVNLINKKRILDSPNTCNM